MAHSTFGQLSQELITVITPIGDLSVLAADEESLRFSNGGDATRLLPSGDAYYLLQGRDREVLIPDGTRRSLLWTSRVWPGAVLHRGEVVGTWRRAQHKVTIEAWSPLSPADRAAIDEEAAGLPIPGLSRDIESIWQ